LWVPFAASPLRRPLTSNVSARMNCVSAIGLAIVASGALPGECKTIDLGAAFKEFDQIASWGAYHHAFERYGPCTDGVIAGQFTEVASRLLASRWEIVDELAKVAEKDPNFLPFVLSNVGDALPGDEWRMIKSNAKTRCPAAARSICDALLVAP